MKLATSSKGKSPFFKHGKLELYTTATKGEIADFTIQNAGQVTIVKVENGKILAAWKRVENILKEY